jgi:hypothetical protein
MIIKNLKKYYTREVQVLYDKNARRRFSAYNYSSTTRVLMRLGERWSMIHFHLSDFTRRSYGTIYIETFRVSSVFKGRTNMSMLIAEIADLRFRETVLQSKMPPEFKLFLPRLKQ